MPFPGARRRRKRIGHKAGRCPRTLFTLGTLLQFSELVMAGEIVYADLRRPGDGFSPAQKCRAPALCPWWHGVLLKVGGLGHLVLLVLVVVLSVQVFQGSLWRTGTNAPWQDGGETQGRNHTERCVISALMRYFCQPRCKSPAGKTPSHPRECSGGTFDGVSSAASFTKLPLGMQVVGPPRIIWQSVARKYFFFFFFDIRGGAGPTLGRKFLTTLPPSQPATRVLVVTQPRSCFLVTKEKRGGKTLKDGERTGAWDGKALSAFQLGVGEDFGHSLGCLMALALLQPVLAANYVPRIGGSTGTDATSFPRKRGTGIKARKAAKIRGLTW
ncbi:uncharacterized protein LOC116960911 isoform X1 [Tyto alba]|uniref:uncharacterized protein LOC116960911 isoform X1 n=1 Tax=Tyto alba TaxID=56313 RepID=UPI001C68605E|nr:uncharacterized protein LOC116960911 isoform X1 [Tyto alba]